MTVMVFAILFMIIGFSAEAIGLGVFSMVVALISFMVGMIAKSNDEESN